MRESTIEKYLVERVKAHGGLCLKFVSPGRRGVPDRICLFPFGEMYFVETKAPKKGATPEQQREHIRLFELGFTTHVISDVSQIDALLP